MKKRGPLVFCALVAWLLFLVWAGAERWQCATLMDWLAGIVGALGALLLIVAFNSRRLLWEMWQCHRLERRGGRGDRETMKKFEAMWRRREGR